MSYQKNDKLGKLMLAAFQGLMGLQGAEEQVDDILQDVVWAPGMTEGCLDESRHDTRV